MAASASVRGRSMGRPFRCGGTSVPERAGAGHLRGVGDCRLAERFSSVEDVTVLVESRIQDRDQYAIWVTRCFSR